jgi:hypothetical protein
MISSYICTLLMVPCSWPQSREAQLESASARLEGQSPEPDISVASPASPTRPHPPTTCATSFADHPLRLSLPFSPIRGAQTNFNHFETYYVVFPFPIPLRSVQKPSITSHNAYISIVVWHHLIST